MLKKKTHKRSGDGHSNEGCFSGIVAKNGHLCG